MRLLVANSSRAMHDVLDRIVAGRRTTEQSVVQALSALERAADRALLAAAAANRAGPRRHAAEVRHLRALRAQVSLVVSDWAADAAS